MITRITLAAMLGLVGVCESSSAQPQTYPSHPVTAIVPFPAGSPLDTVARIVGERMRLSLGQAVVVENVTGAAGSLGVARAARAAPDGYTVSIGNFSSHVLTGMIYAVPYDATKDFDPVALLASNPQLLIGRNALPVHDLKELIAWLKANPDKASAGTAGIGSVSHVAGLFFQKETGTRFQFVPYRGVNLARQDLIGGHIDLLFDQAASALPNVRAGKVTAYAVTATMRLPSARDIPTVDEAGVPGLYMSIWSAVWAPRGTARQIITRLNSAAVESLTDAVVKKRLIDLGMEIPTTDEQTPQALGMLHKAEMEKWWPIIKAANIRAN